jgi:hypothetical protein
MRAGEAIIETARLLDREERLVLDGLGPDPEALKIGKQIFTSCGHRQNDRDGSTREGRI